MKKRITFIIILMLILCLFQPSYSFAFSLDNMVTGADVFIETGKQVGETEGGTITNNSINTLSDKIYNVLLILGTVIAVVVGAILAIQFIVGSVEQKSKIKESLIPYFAGCAVVFGAFGIWKLTVTIGRNLSLTDEQIAAQIAAQQEAERKAQEEARMRETARQTAQNVSSYLDGTGLRGYGYSETSSFVVDNINVAACTDEEVIQLWENRGISNKVIGHRNETLTLSEIVAQVLNNNEDRLVYVACTKRGLVAKTEFWQLIRTQNRQIARDLALSGLSESLIETSYAGRSIVSLTEEQLKELWKQEEMNGTIFQLDCKNDDQQRIYIACKNRGLVENGELK